MVGGQDGIVAPDQDSESLREVWQLNIEFAVDPMSQMARGTCKLASGTVVVAVDTQIVVPVPITVDPLPLQLEFEQLMVVLEKFKKKSLKSLRQSQC